MGDFSPVETVPAADAGVEDYGVQPGDLDVFQGFKVGGRGGGGGEGAMEELVGGGGDGGEVAEVELDRENVNAAGGLVGVVVLAGAGAEGGGGFGELLGVGAEGGDGFLGLFG